MILLREKQPAFCSDLPISTRSDRSGVKCDFRMDGVPHVRFGVRGTIKTGEAHQCFSLNERDRHSK